MVSEPSEAPASAPKAKPASEKLAADSRVIESAATEADLKKGNIIIDHCAAGEPKARHNKNPDAPKFPRPTCVFAPIHP